MSEEELRARFAKLTDGRLPLPTGLASTDRTDDVSTAEETAMVLAQAQDEARLDLGAGMGGSQVTGGEAEEEGEDGLSEAELMLIAQGKLPSRYAPTTPVSAPFPKTDEGGVDNGSGNDNPVELAAASTDKATTGAPLAAPPASELLDVDTALPLDELAGQWAQQGDVLSTGVASEAGAVMGITQAQLKALGLELDLSASGESAEARARPGGSGDVEESTSNGSSDSE